MKTLRRWKYDGIPYRACVMLVGSLTMYDIILFENCRTRKREAGIFRNLSFGDYFVKTCVFSARKRRLLGR